MQTTMKKTKNRSFTLILILLVVSFYALAPVSHAVSKSDQDGKPGISQSNNGNGNSNPVKRQ